MPSVVGRLLAPRLSSPPGSPSVGEMYYDTSTSKLFWWNGTRWFDATGGGGGSAWVSALSAARVGDVGMSGQIRAGRVITLADFTTQMGLSTPAALWQLGNTGDSSNNSRNLVNKGAMTFGQGVNGTDTGGAAYFSGASGQALYVADTGSSDKLRIATGGSWGAWFKTAKRTGVTDQLFVSKWRVSSALRAWCLDVISSNVAVAIVSPDGTAQTYAFGVTDVADDRWHFAVATADGTTLRLYVDGALEGAAPAGLIFNSSAPVNIGGFDADASTVTGAPFFGQIAQAFVTADVLSLEQIRFLYCARIPHTLAKAPAAVALDVRRLRKGAALATTDFPTPPLRLYNFTAGSVANEGSAGTAPLSFYAGAPSSGPDGTRQGGYYVTGIYGGSTSAYTDLPQGTTPRSYGSWFQTTMTTQVTVMTWGDLVDGDASIVIGHGSAGCIQSRNTADYTTVGPCVAAGLWILAGGVETTAAADGVLRKLYLDGKLVASSTVMNSIPYVTSSIFRLAAGNDGKGNTIEGLTGSIDGAFLCNYALTGPQIAALYAKGSVVMAASSRDPGSHVEAMDASNVYATFDTLDSQHRIDLAVGA